MCFTFSQALRIQVSMSRRPRHRQSQGDMKLIKLGDEVHGPEDAMVINRDQMLFLKILGLTVRLFSSFKVIHQGKSSPNPGGLTQVCQG